MFVGVCEQVCELQLVFSRIVLFLCVSVCLAALFLILGVDILEDKGPIELRATNACSVS